METASQQVLAPARSANRTIIEAFTARSITLGRAGPTPQTPHGLPKHVRYLCAMRRRVRVGVIGDDHGHLIETVEAIQEEVGGEVHIGTLLFRLEDSCGAFP